jgi:HSP20 family protein
MPSTKLQRRPFGAPLMSTIAREVDQLQASVRRMFEHPLAAIEPMAFPEPIGWFPPVEITESPAELTITAELPGLDRKDVHVDLDDNVLTLRGEKREVRVEEEKDRQYHLEERSYGAFQRSFTLPPAVDREHITAEFEKGVLTLRLPKTAEAKSRAREIAVVAK